MIRLPPRLTRSGIADYFVPYKSKANSQNHRICFGTKRLKQVKGRDGHNVYPIKGYYLSNLVVFY